VRVLTKRPAAVAAAEGARKLYGEDHDGPPGPGIGSPLTSDHAPTRGHALPTQAPGRSSQSRSHSHAVVLYRALNREIPLCRSYSNDRVALFPNLFRVGFMTPD
jgi:hypothetical protein